MHLLDGIDKNDSLENLFCLTDSIGEEKIAKMNLQISARKIYGKTSSYKDSRLKNMIKN